MPSRSLKKFQNTREIKEETLTMSSSSFRQSRSDGPFLYIFTSVTGSNDYIMYRIDALKHLDNKPPSNNIRRPYNLRPLLVFPNPVLPETCMCAKLGSNFYFFGGWAPQPSFRGKCKFSQGTEVYRIRESDLNDIDPSERNTNGGKYLIQCAPMNGQKHPATFFVAENKLYVLSWSISDTQFEVFDPRLKSWRVLPSQPDGYGGGFVTCYVVVGKTVYFTIHDDEVLLSFDLEKEKWGIVMTNNDSLPSDSFEPYTHLVVIGDMAFGVLYDQDKNVFDEDEGQRNDLLTICATPLPHKESFISHEFMRPSIPLDNKFLDALSSSRCPHVTTKYSEDFSDYMVALDGGKVLCVISYGSDLDNDNYTSYVTLTFFEVTPRRGRACNVGNANEMADGKYEAARCLKAKLLHSAHFIIRTVNLSTCGQIEACFSEGL